MHRIEFVHGSGKRKTELQRDCERLTDYLERLEKYREALGICGKRKSYSKTDTDATFMRMKEDHMRNGQLKPGYNVQIGVESEYIVGIGLFENPTDTLTLIPFLERIQQGSKRKYENIIADAGYASEENYTYLEQQGQRAYIKPADYEVRKKKKFKNDIYRAENMHYDDQNDCYSVSFEDGTKFQNKIGDHKELRRVSDEICREHGLSVLENSSFYGGHKKDYWRHKSGKKTHRDYLREDVEYCLSFATTPREFENQLYALGYTLDPVRFSVKAKHWERSVRLDKIGFSKEVIQEQLDENAINRFRLFTLEYKPPYRPKKFPLEDELRKLEFAIDHSYDAATVLVDTIFYLVITVIQIAAELADVILLSPDLRAAEKDLKEFIADYRFMQEQDIHTAADLQANIDESKAQLSDLERERKTLGNRIRRPKSPEEQVKNKECRKEISKQMKPVRERLRRAEKILEKSPHLYELLKQENTI